MGSAGEEQPLLPTKQEFDRKESAVSYGSYENCTPVHGPHDEHFNDATAVNRLYISHFLSALKDRLWQFAVPILLMEIWTETMLPAALAAFTCNVMAFLMMPYVGAWADRNDRLKTIRVSIFGESLCIISSGTLMFLLAKNAGKAEPMPIWDTYQITLFSLISFINGSCEVFMRIGQQSLEKDWAIIVAQHVGIEMHLINQKMRTIDLSCKLIGPAAFGLFVQAGSQSLVDRLLYTLTGLVVWSILSCPVEYISVSKVYFGIPRIREKMRKKGATSHLKVLYTGWNSYVSHRVFIPSLALATLYYTVLDNGVLMTAYLKWQGVPDAPLGASRGLGAIMGIFGTLVCYNLLLQLTGSVERLGALAVWLFFLMLTPISFAFYTGGSGMYSSVIMITCVTISRAMLWVFDQAIVRIMQDNVSESKRGVINGVHTAVCQLFLMGGSITGVLFSDPRQFLTLVLVSIGAVFTACVLYTYWALTHPKASRGAHTAL